MRTSRCVTREVFDGSALWVRVLSVEPKGCEADWRCSLSRRVMAADLKCKHTTECSKKGLPPCTWCPCLIWFMVMLSGKRDCCIFRTPVKNGTATHLIFTCAACLTGLIVFLKVRDLLAGTFNQLVKAVALAADAGNNDGDGNGDGSRDGDGDGQAGRRQGGDGVSGTPSTKFSGERQFQEQTPAAAAAAEDKFAGDTVEEDGEVQRFVAWYT